MKPSEITVDCKYFAQVSREVHLVRIVRELEKGAYEAFDATDNRTILLKNAKKILRKGK